MPIRARGRHWVISKPSPHKTHEQNADGRRDLDLVLRLSQLRGLDFVGHFGIERARLCGGAGHLVCRAVRLETKKFRANFSATPPVEIPPPFPKTVSARISGSCGDGISRWRDLCAE